MSDIAPRKFDLPHLGDDLLWKIFAKADPKSVGRLKTTNKVWNFKLTSQLFVKQNFLENQHKNRSVIVGVGYPPLDDFCQWFVRAEADSGNQIQLNIPVDINNFGFYTFVGSDHGILCIRLSQGAINSSLFIWNPLTRESKFAIDVARKHQCYAVSLYAFGFLHGSFEYRVLHVFKK
ncbi:hypothetical protein HN51_058549 [Arachis hypogaea]|nr:uncharacterized protein LOC112785638 [Arachis hypogaea]